MNKVWTHSASISVLTWLWTLPLESKPLTDSCKKSSAVLPHFNSCCCFFFFFPLSNAVSFLLRFLIILLHEMLHPCFIFRNVFYRQKICCSFQRSLIASSLLLFCMLHLTSLTSSISAGMFKILMFIWYNRSGFTKSDADTQNEDQSVFAVCAETDGSCSWKQLCSLHNT